MNALEASTRISYLDSVCYEPSLQVSVDPFKTYEFNARLAVDPGFRRMLETDAARVLREFGFDEIDFSKHKFVCPALSEREMEALNSVALIVQRRGILGNMALEQTVATDGYGMPAILALLIWVAVAVCACLWVSIAGKSALSVSKEFPFYIEVPGSGVVPI